MTDNGTSEAGVPDAVLPFGRVAVLGAGAWGTALAIKARRAGRGTILWGRDAAQVAGIRADGENARYLPGIALPQGLEATDDVAQAVSGADAVLLVTPSRTIRDVCRMMAPHLGAGVPVAICAKGIERDSGLLLAQTAAEELPDHPIGALSGPTFAREAALGHPTAATIAFPFDAADRDAPQGSVAARLALSLAGETFRPYVSDDLVGVEVGGAVKNVIAIACGMMTGAGFAENTRAALITRGLNEMKSLAEALGGRTETVTGLSGAGDLVLTCSSPTSRNMSLGMQLGQGLPRARCFEGRDVVVEGEVNALSVVQLARRIGVPMPICEGVNAVLHEGASMGDTFARIWSRPLRAEPREIEVQMSHPAEGARIDKLAERFR